MLNVTFHGVRGSTPCHGPYTDRYGGNTACVSVMAPGQRPLLLDLGTGLRYFGKSFVSPSDGPLDAVALVTHMHWDHIQGLPFFGPIIKEGAHLEIFGPRQADGSSFFDAVRNAIKQPTFPVELHDLRGKIEFHDLENCDFRVDGYSVKSRLVPHIGPTLGYRVEMDGASVAYISDHQQPVDGSFELPDGVRELAEGVDLLIHDSQYTPREFIDKAHWGHCTAEFAVRVANECGARKLALFHHDPDRTDDELDVATACFARSVTEVFVAREGATISL